MDAGKKSLVIAEAKQLETMMVWKVLQNDIKYQANHKMFISSKNDMDIVMGKSWTYVLDIIKTRLSSLRKGSGRFNK